MTAHDEWPGPVKAEPDFSELLKVLRRERPSRPVLSELFLNEPLYRAVVAPDELASLQGHPLEKTLVTIRAFRNLGYDYATVHATDLRFARAETEKKDTISLNEGGLISDRASFEKYPWPDFSACPYTRLSEGGSFLPDGMKFVVMGPGGVLENVIWIVGYERLCMLIFDDPVLVESIFSEVGRRLVEYYRIALQYECVGAIWANDDWGFKTQTMLAPSDMRRFVVPWHGKIAETAHAAGKPVIMHSCGCLEAVMDDVIDVIKHDGKHSYEDAIEPVEQFYDRYSSRIAVVGGMDMDFVCRSSPAQVYERARAMLERSRASGGYALGTGNSVPEYVPRANYFAMLAAANKERDSDWAAWAERLPDRASK